MVDYLGKYGYAPDSEAMGRALEMVAANLENIACENVYKHPKMGNSDINIK